VALGYFLCSFAAGLCYQGLVKQVIILSQLTDQFQVDISAQVTSVVQVLISLPLVILHVMPYTCSAHMPPLVRYLLLILILDMDISAGLCQTRANCTHKLAMK